MKKYRVQIYKIDLEANPPRTAFTENWHVHRNLVDEEVRSFDEQDADLIAETLYMERDENPIYVGDVVRIEDIADNDVTYAMCTKSGWTTFRAMDDAVATITLNAYLH